MSQAHYSESSSLEIARAAVRMAVTATREEEKELRESLRKQEVYSVAADFGGDFLTSVERVIERALSAAKREGLIQSTFREEGAVAGATHEALSQLMQKAQGLSVGGKIGIARKEDNVAVALFFSIGMTHLDEVCVGMGHRVL